ncbi:RNA 2'-phosphotransferase [Tahibacter amnicola]|uniref:Probable RNA 2'-phosphotransferase n=1 Tax=Tahibacter amnicola TaxID=2976241 RepID=A0ABY6BBT0_9GAMM|nr:RNA 2'-phosphotransferase [Tahibacter amnicola]UXI67262.1 RNA 2'-phosphotransferase [Tahibacter amnicola]
MSAKDDIRVSKFLSYVLRHAPESIGLALDREGWSAIDVLVVQACVHGMPVTRDQVLRVVATSDKQRFSISPDGLRIRAAQGHSVPVDLGLPPLPPPVVLYHGTAVHFAEAIRREGLTPRSRRQVHLSCDKETARRVGERHGTPLVLVVDCQRMHAEGYVFFRADNGVWLTDRVPPRFLDGVEADSDE